MPRNYSANYNDGKRDLKEYYGQDDDEVIVHHPTAIQEDRRRHHRNGYSTGFDNAMPPGPSGQYMNGRGPPVDVGPDMFGGPPVNGRLPKNNYPPPIGNEPMNLYEQHSRGRYPKMKDPRKPREFSPRRKEKRPHRRDDMVPYGGNTPYGPGGSPYALMDGPNIPQFNDRRPQYGEETYDKWAGPPGRRGDRYADDRDRNYPRAMSDIGHGGPPEAMFPDFSLDRPPMSGERAVRLSNDDYNAATRRNLAVWSNWRTAMNEQILDGRHRAVPTLDDALNSKTLYDFDTPVRVDDPSTLMKYATAANEGTGLYADDFVQYGIPRVEISRDNLAVRQLDKLGGQERGRPREKQREVMVTNRRDRSYERAPMSRAAEAVMAERRAMSPPPRLNVTAAAYDREEIYGRIGGTRGGDYQDDEDVYGALHSNMLNELTQSLNRNRPTRRY